MGVSDYVWERLPATKILLGRKVVDRLVAEAMHGPVSAGPGGERIATDRITAAVRRDGSLGLVVLSWVLPYIASAVVKLVLEWLSKDGAAAAMTPRIET